MSHATYEVTSRPTRVCCLTEATSGGDYHTRALNLLTHLWGGGASHILPVGRPDLDLIAEATLRFDRPDIVLIFGDDPQRWASVADECCQPLRTWHMQGRDWRVQLRRRDLDLMLAGVAVREIERKHPYLKDSQIRLGRIDPNTQLHELSQFAHGTLDPDDVDGLAYLGGSFDRIDSNTDYPAFVRQQAGADGYLNWFAVAEFGLTSRNLTGLHSPVAVVLVADASTDLPLYWNLRAAGGVSAPTTVLPLPIEFAELPDALEAVVDWVRAPRRWVASFDYIEIASLSATTDAKERLARRLRGRLHPFGIRHVDIDQDRRMYPCRQLVSQKAVVDVQTENRVILMVPPSLDLASPPTGRVAYMLDVTRDPSIKRRPFELDCHVSRASVEVLRAFTPPSMPVKPEASWSHRTLTLLCRADRSSIRYQIPTNRELLHAHLESKGYKIEYDDKQKAYEAALDRIGHVWHAAELFSAVTRPYVYALAKERLTMHQLQQKVKPRRKSKKKKSIGVDPMDDVYSMANLNGGALHPVSERRFREHLGVNLSFAPTLQELLAKWQAKGLLRTSWRYGNCLNCGATRWIDVAVSQSGEVCERCGERLPVPSTLQAGFELHESISKAVKHGGDAVVLATRLFRSMAHEGFSYLPGVKCSLDAQVTDFDLLCTVDGGIAVGECKSRHRGPITSDDEAQMIQQFSTLVEHAQRLDARLAFFALLGTDPTPKLRRHIRSLGSSSVTTVLIETAALDEGRIRDADNNHSFKSFAQIAAPEWPMPRSSCSRRRGKRIMGFGAWTETRG